MGARVIFATCRAMQSGQRCQAGYKLGERSEAVAEDLELIGNPTLEPGPYIIAGTITTCTLKRGCVWRGPWPTPGFHSGEKLARFRGRPDPGSNSPSCSRAGHLHAQAKGPCDEVGLFLMFPLNSVGVPQFPRGSS
ncbi:unnamed protein product [Lepidochelys olivacea]